MKIKMDPEKKFKLIYSGEFLAFSLVFLVLGFLKLFGIIGTNSTYRLVFSILTSCGAVFIIGDFVLSLVNKKRRAKVCLIDKILGLPAAAYLIVFNILSFCAMGGLVTLPEEFYKISMAVVIFYLSGDYCFQGIYHYFVPTKEFLDALEEDKKEKARKAQLELEKVQQEAQKEEKPTEDGK